MPIRPLSENAKRALIAILREDADADEDRHETKMAEKTLKRAAAADDFLEVRQKMQDMLHAHLEAHGQNMDARHRRHFGNIDRAIERAGRPIKKISSTSKAAGRSYNRNNPDFPEVAKKEPYSPVPPAKKANPTANIKQVSAPGMVKK